MKYLIFFIYLSFSAISQAAIEANKFDSPEQEKLFVKMTEELRCLVCQNQNIAGSNAELATDLRNKTYTLIKAGKNEDEIKTWMIERYGAYVLYKPPFKKETIILWVGPGVLFFIAIFVVVRISKKGDKKNLNATQQQKIHDLMKSKGNS